MNYGIRDYLYALKYGPDEDGCPDCGCLECECEFDENGALVADLLPELDPKNERKWA